MRKEEFISKVEYLLSDISNEEKYDAINYYRDYIEEAGPEKEEEVLAEFGSPERIAAIIRSDLKGDMKDGGEFTENGYKDPRFDGPENSIVKAKPEAGNNEEKYEYSEQTNSNDNVKKESLWNRFKAKVNNMFGDNMSKTTKIVIIVLLIIILFPVLLGTGTFILSSLGSVAGFIVSLFFLVGIVTAILLIGAVVLLFTSFGFMFVSGGIAAVLIGAALTSLGLGLLSLVLSVLFYGKFIPFVFKKIKGLFTNKKEA